MGGHHSKQSMKATSSIVTKVSSEQTQNCIQVADGTNLLNVYGNANVVTHITQDMTFEIKADCVNQMVESNKFEADLQNQIQQQLKSQDIAMTSWLSAGSDNQSAEIDNSVTTLISTKVIQNCLTSLTGRNVINIQGSNNVVSDVVQQQSQSALTSCIQGTKESNSTIANITNVANQALSHIDKNPFAFITDAIKAVVTSIAVLIGVVVVAVVMMVIVGKTLSLSKKKKHADLPPLHSHTPP